MKIQIRFSCVLFLHARSFGVLFLAGGNITHLL